MRLLARTIWIWALLLVVAREVRRDGVQIGVADFRLAENRHDRETFPHVHLDQLGRQIRAIRQQIKMYVRNGLSIMPIFRKTEISDADLDAIAEYLTRNNKK